MSVRYHIGIIAFLFMDWANASAAPPTATYFYPAGGQRGTTVEVSVGGSFDRWPVQTWASDKALTVVAGKEKGKLSIAVAANAAPGVYWARIADNRGASGLRPFVVGTLPEVLEIEPNDDIAKPQSIASSCIINGRLGKKGDVDVFAIKLKVGETLVASVDANRSLKSPMDGTLQVLSADGFVLDQNNDWHGLDPQVTFTAKKDGTYLVRVFAFPAAPDGSIHFAGGDAYVYRLTLTTGGFADFAVPLAIARHGTGEVEVVGWNVPAIARRLPLPVATDGDFTSLHHPLLANILRVKRPPHSCWDAIAPTGAKRPEIFAAPFSLTGRLDKPDAPAIVSVTGKKGQALKVRVEARELGFPLDPVLRILDSAGKSLASAEPPEINKDCALTYIPVQDGPVRIEVSDVHTRGGPRFVYLLTVEVAQPDFNLSVAADRFTMTPGKPFDLPVTIQRFDGFAQAIDFTFEGLPASVTALVVPPPAKDDGKPPILRLSATKGGVSGPIRIVGRIKDRPELTRFARATVAEFETTTSDLWITVVDPAEK